jgi:hypothetical protein
MATIASQILNSLKSLSALGKNEMMLSSWHSHSQSPEEMKIGTENKMLSKTHCLKMHLFELQSNP